MKKWQKFTIFNFKIKKKIEIVINDYGMIIPGTYPPVARGKILNGGMSILNLP